MENLFEMVKKGVYYLVILGIGVCFGIARFKGKKFDLKEEISMLLYGCLLVGMLSAPTLFKTIGIKLNDLLPTVLDAAIYFLEMFIALFKDIASGFVPKV